MRKGDGGANDHTPRDRNRRSIRLQGYDYSQAGAYFVTICTQNRECLFGGVMDGEMGSILSEVSRVFERAFRKEAVEQTASSVTYGVLLAGGMLVLGKSGVRFLGEATP